ncbi:small glutamine-rich tetratricopeptide repeat-containing protein-like isoform X1 [Iris pallida]|uniref:Small glutamine-rich tetratricopeptide repeat-containing protein-like isoform X1 n=1 Tax=Iris pallida TaxID=29817 RepID=A0AAX6F7J5_IRIPA|nr:small glutamine-rich tetratricopeptide repeat-containing protein-like isoform X1 [Iris pallida]
MTTLRSDSRTCRRVVLAFMDFLDSVQPAPGVDFEGISVVKDCLKEIFKINVPAADVEIQPGMLIDLFSSHEHAETGKSKSVMGPSPVEGMSCTTSALQNVEDSRCSKAKDPVGDPHSIEGDSKDQLMGNFFAALDKINFFKSSPTGIEDPAQIAKATELFSEAIKDMENSQGQIMNLSNLAETFKMRGNKCMQAKLYSDAIQLYTCAIALSEKNAIYYGNRAAAFTEMHRYTEAIQDCSKAIEIDPSYSKAYSRLGLAYYAQGKYKEALEKGFFKGHHL